MISITSTNSEIQTKPILTTQYQIYQNEDGYWVLERKSDTEYVWSREFNNRISLAECFIADHLYSVASI